MTIDRDILPTFETVVRGYPIVTVTGPIESSLIRCVDHSLKPGSLPKF